MMPEQLTNVEICKVSDLVANSGVAALIGGEQIALFYLPSLTPQVYALGNKDPFSGANVLARGLVGDVGGVPVVCSPIYKQNFELMTGQCLEDEQVQVPCYRVVVDDDVVWLED